MWRMVTWGDSYGYFGAPGNAKQRRKLRRFAQRAGLYVMPAFHLGGVGQWRGDRT